MISHHTFHTRGSRLVTTHEASASASLARWRIGLIEPSVRARYRANDSRRLRRITVETPILSLVKSWPGCASKKYLSPPSGFSSPASRSRTNPYFWSVCFGSQRPIGLHANSAPGNQVHWTSASSSQLARATVKPSSSHGPWVQASAKLIRLLVALSG